MTATLVMEKVTYVWWAEGSADFQSVEREDATNRELVLFGQRSLLPVFRDVSFADA